MSEIPEFSVVPGHAVHEALRGRRVDIIDLVADTYRLHGEGGTVNPPSYFLRFPDRPSARMIALPASVGGRDAVDGIKWISSFPTNLQRGIPRASALLILNDPATGYPLACLESSIISAVRTAASAAVAAKALTSGRHRPRRLGFIGTGLIARYTFDYLAELGWGAEVSVFDLNEQYAAAFADYVHENSYCAVERAASAADLIQSCDVIVFATTAATPHVTEPAWFAHHPVVLHVSLRDLSTDVILNSMNVVDDVEHVLKADTSVHLTEQATNGRAFLHATLHEVLAGKVVPPSDRTVVFSPFGLGVLDLAVGVYVYRRTAAAGSNTVIDGFFHDLDRHRAPQEAQP